MADEVQPLPIPGQDPSPDVIGLINADFATEGTADAAEHDFDHAPSVGAFLGVHEADAARAQGRDQVAAPDVEVGEVGAVGFVQVVVAFEEGGAGGADDGGEEMRVAGGDRGGGEDDVSDEGGEEADLLGGGGWVKGGADWEREGKAGGRRTCHMKGQDLRFRSAKMMARRRQVPPVEERPRTRLRRPRDGDVMVGGRSGGAKRVRRRRCDGWGVRMRGLWV